MAAFTITDVLKRSNFFTPAPRAKTRLSGIKQDDMTWYKTDNPHIPVNVPVIVAIVNNFEAREAVTAYYDGSYWRNDKGYRLINKPYAWAYFPTPPDPKKISQPTRLPPPENKHR